MYGVYTQVGYNMSFSLKNIFKTNTNKNNSINIINNNTTAIRELLIVIKDLHSLITLLEKRVEAIEKKV